MMGELLKRGDALAHQAQLWTVRRMAERLSSVLGATAVEAEEARVLVRGRGLVRRWLLDPRLRFLGGGSK